MAKKRAAAKKTTPSSDEPKVTKSQAIRDALTAHRNLGPKEIAEKLAATGLNVKAVEVSNIKYQMKTKKRGRKAAKKAEAPVPAADDMISMAALKAAKKLADELGGVDNAKRVIESLGRLVE